MGSEKEEKLYTLKRVEAYDGGIGAFAARPIACGEVILREAPLVRCTLETLDASMQALDEGARRRFFSLCDWRATASAQPKTALGVFQSNGYPCGDDAGVFLAFARFNHSCSPNVSHKFDGTDRFVFAARAIAAGEELCTTYAALALPRAARRSLLSGVFGFDCSCACCGLENAALAASDVRRQRIAALDDSIFALASKGRYADAVVDARERLSLLTTEGLGTPENLLRTAHDALQASDHAGDAAAQAEWLAKVISWTKLCVPETSPDHEALRTALAALA
ncbi:hypothetical protein M885DRAFT_506048 [Pelagophyceae sp. CCMP2097]|nr:hypothetical protein M885DRAFT_506048 [Pelagophyceae sp. CCMP2097]|mmetsp:Transcript_7726/g.25217  ORF Transcript_7726/g.25217 Transcript_7726/m.25217 type:complete len:280 (-) Transcript_7726:486-1325(-)